MLLRPACEFVPADDRGIRLETEIAPDIECSFNASLISRVIYNLLQNAYKYGRDNGYVRLSLNKEDGSAVIRVRDNGQGIAEEDLDKIWQRFWQADSSRGPEAGNGLGLSMVKEIAEIHGGSVRAESTQGKGSEFIFSIPLEA
jgi:signal transduction histidine kinase